MKFTPVCFLTFVLSGNLTWHNRTLEKTLGLHTVI